MRDNLDFRRLWTRYGLIALMVIVVSVMHYTTAMHLHAAHGIYRRLYYFPIIIAAFRGGWPAGLSTALLVCAFYIPHAFLGVGHDPAPALEKTLEMGLYAAVGLVCGILVTREQRTLSDLRATTAELERALGEKTAMEGELIRAARLAAVGRLSAGLAHEIRNPLASIKGAAEVLADDFPADHPKGKLLRILGDESRRLNDVLTRFLAFARSPVRRRERFDLAEEARRVVELLGHQDDAPAIAGPGAAEALTLTGDREQVRQLLINLVTNAAQAAGPGGRIEVSLRTEGGEALCAVDDDGPGFSDEAQANFATPFFTTREGGTGLGLAICHRIVADHAGRIAAGAGPLGGARVEVALPLGAD